MPVKVVPPVLISNQSIASKQDIGPITVMSGFMTKKSRSLNRWKRRWWQLLDNGYLFYFKSDDRLKVLGQIDIARSCYDVRLGSENCRTTFPRAAPACCCISFAVLKRNYFMYTPTAGEAKRWVESISTISRVINRKVIAGVEHRKAPPPPGGLYGMSSMRLTRVKMQKMKTISDSCEDLRVDRTRSSNLASQRSMAASVPDSLDKIADDGVSLGSLGSRLWLDGSPPVSQSNQVYPHDSPPPVADVSWEEAPTALQEEGREKEEEEAGEQREVLSHTQIGLSQIPHAKERHHSLQLKDEDLCSNIPPASDDGTLFNSKGLSRSLENLVSNNSNRNQQQRPVPKPRKERAQTSAPVLEAESRSQEEPRPQILPDLLLSPMRPRNNSEPPSIRPRKASHSRSKKGSRKSRGGSRKLSPPSTPPPPPPPLNEDAAAPPPPSQLSLSYSTLNRPTFVPPPPPAAEE